ncbi:ferric reductase-like transmembrane domain-containing protein [Kordiimonas aestuarii]|uniref:ferric reductase-like transmembrane domain-containing protein n=1 Tax=Kordiimonas aestuarii TaxID=1005925 RepID=UPI0021D32A5B|nr:ferric reductase-like transmembrane domain-containing protein [Kordiimonas aestuarii]
MTKWIEGKRLFIPVALILFGYIYSQIEAAGSYVAALPYIMSPTAQMGFVLFFFAFTASALARLAPGPGPKFLMRNRRYIGLSFALVHFVHGGIVLSNLALTEASRGIPELMVGGLAYLFLGLMALTSNNASVRKLGAKRWKRLHKVGSYYIWLIFVVTSLGRVASFGPEPGHTWVPILGLVALGLRIAAHQKGKRKKAA